jgi:S-formylglutathione hydrolase
MPGLVSAQESRFLKASISSALVPSPVDVGVLLPPRYGSRSEGYPLLLLLHGGKGSSSFLLHMKPVIDRAWARGDLPHMVVATPSAARSFYLDYPDGSQMWETFILTEVLPYLRDRYWVEPDKGTFLAGISMGGMGALRMAFKDPTAFRGVAVLEPAIPVVFSFDELDGASLRRDEVYLRLFGDPVDEDYYQMNNPLFIARRDMAMLQDSRLALYLEAGDLDQFGYDHSTEVLHRLLQEGGFKHEYRLLRGVGHFGWISPRIAEALKFIGKVSRDTRLGIVTSRPADR